MIAREIDTIGLYYKHITILNDDSKVTLQIVVSLSDDCRDVIYVPR